MWPGDKAWGDVKPHRSHCPPPAPTRAHLTCENSLGGGEHLFQALWRHPPQSDPGVLTAYRGCRIVTTGPRLPGSPCSHSETRDPPSGPAAGLLTYSKAVGVKGVPGKVGHSCPILQCGQHCVRQAAGLLQLWEVSPSQSPSVTGRVAGLAAPALCSRCPTTGWPKLSASATLCSEP